MRRRGDVRSSDHPTGAVPTRSLLLGIVALAVGFVALVWLGTILVTPTGGVLGVLLGALYVLAWYWVVAGIVTRVSGLRPATLILAVVDRMR